MWKARTLAAACGSVLLGFAASAMAQRATTRPAAGAPTTQPSDRADEKAVIAMLNRVPGDAVGFVLIPSPKGVCERADAFFQSFAPKEVAGQFNAHKSFLDEHELGEGFDDAGPLAIVLLDPKSHAPKRDTKPADEEDEESPTPPMLFLLSCKDPAKMFPGREVKKDGELQELTRNGDTAWALHKDGVMYVSTVRKVLADLKEAASVVPRLSKGAEAMLLRADAAAWLDVRKFGAIKDAIFHDGAILDHLPFFLEDLGDEDNPPGKIVRWFRMTRAGVLTSAEQWTFALSLPPAGPVIEARGSYAPGGPMAKALAGAKGAGGALTAGLPDKPFLFAYGIRKDLFSTPTELKKTALAAIVEGNALDPATAEMKKQVGAMIEAVHGQVTEVQHWAGQAREDGPLAVATVVRCRDAEALRKAVKEHVPAFQTVLNHAFGLLDQSEDERIKLILEEANEPAEGQVKVDSILLSSAVLDKGIEDEPEMARRWLLRLFPGEMKIRARLAVADPRTLVVTIGGGKRFLNDAVAAAKAGAGKAEQGADAKAALALLPANRFAVGMFSVTGAGSFYGSAMISMFAGGARIHFSSAPPVVLALSADRGELLVTAHVPSVMIQRIVGKVSGEEGLEEEEEDAISVQKKVTVPPAAPAPADD